MAKRKAYAQQMSKCKVCRAEFVRRSMSHKCCSAECAATWVAKENARKEARKARDERRQDNEARLRLKTWREWIADTQAAFNRYVRLRDAGKPCISCGDTLAVRGNGQDGAASGVGGMYDCGHFRSVGSAPHLRFVELNAHKQCKRCNRYASGNHSAYRVGLVARIGLDAVEALEADQTPRKYTIEDLKALKSEYNRRARELEKKHERT